MTVSIGKIEKVAEEEMTIGTKKTMMMIKTGVKAVTIVALQKRLSSQGKRSTPGGVEGVAQEIEMLTGDRLDQGKDLLTEKTRDLTEEKVLVREIALTSERSQEKKGMELNVILERGLLRREVIECCQSQENALQIVWEEMIAKRMQQPV